MGPWDHERLFWQKPGASKLLLCSALNSEVPIGFLVLQGET
jgi:hypothetical protein